MFDSAAKITYVNIVFAYFGVLIPTKAVRSEKNFVDCNKFGAFHFGEVNREIHLLIFVQLISAIISLASNFPLVQMRELLN